LRYRKNRASAAHARYGGGKDIPPCNMAIAVRQNAERLRVEIRNLRLEAGMARRDATRCLSVMDRSWQAHDLLTLAADLAEDAELRRLTVRARTVLQNWLIAQVDPDDWVS